MAHKSTIWPIYGVGTICFAVAGVVAAITLIGDWTSFVASPAQELAVGLPFLAGLAAFRAGFEERRRQRELGAPVAPARRKRARLEAPPRIGDDPFRDPPGAPPIVVERPAVAVSVSIVPGIRVFGRSC